MEESRESKPAAGKAALSGDELQRHQKKADLVLSRKRIARQLETNSNEKYSELLRRTLADLDKQIAEL